MRDHTIPTELGQISISTDYVGKPPNVESITVPGSHVSPHEAVEHTKAAIKRVVGLANTNSA